MGERAHQVHSDFECLPADINVRRTQGTENVHQDFLNHARVLLFEVREPFEDDELDCM